MMQTLCFPAFRSRLAALGCRTVRALRQATLDQLQSHLRDLIPAHLLGREEEGAGSRDRVFSLRLTFECFLWQMLKPNTSCREVVRQVQALWRLAGRTPIDEGDSAYVQARQRLPRQRLEKALRATAQSADQRGSWTARPRNCPTPPKIKNAIPSPVRKSPGAVFPSCGLSR
jgi:hypothetical protein